MESEARGLVAGLGGDGGEEASRLEAGGTQGEAPGLATRNQAGINRRVISRKTNGNRTMFHGARMLR